MYFIQGLGTTVTIYAYRFAYTISFVSIVAFVSKG